MARKTALKKAEAQDQTPSVSETPETDRNTLIAELSTQGVLTNSMMIVDFNKDYIAMALDDCAMAVKTHVQRIHDGDMTVLEGMLAAQAVTLDNMFCTLGRRGNANLAQYPNAAEKYIKLALKAQSQCRSTIEALAIIKNPQPYIQNNRAQYQQVNNAVPPHTREKPNMPNELNSQHAEAPHA
jgi:hypothetical protein